MLVDGPFWLQKEPFSFVFIDLPQHISFWWPHVSKWETLAPLLLKQVMLAKHTFELVKEEGPSPTWAKQEDGNQDMNVLCFGDFCTSSHEKSWHQLNMPTQEHNGIHKGTTELKINPLENVCSHFCFPVRAVSLVCVRRMRRVGSILKNWAKMLTRTHCHWIHPAMDDLSCKKVMLKGDWQQWVHQNETLIARQTTTS